MSFKESHINPEPYHLYDVSSSDFKLVRPKTVDLTQYIIEKAFPEQHGTFHIPEYPDGFFYKQVRGDYIVIKRIPNTSIKKHEEGITITDWDSDGIEDIVATYRLDEGLYELIAPDPADTT